MFSSRTIGLTLCLGVLIATTGAEAATPDLMNFQGQLDTGGVAFDGTANMTFAIYSQANGGSPLWTETHSSVHVSDGLFNVILGSDTALTDATFSGADRWLGIKIDSDPEMTPRTRLTSVAYSHRVTTVDGATGGVISGDVSIQSTLTVDGTIDANGMDSKIRFHYNDFADLPDPTAYHGMFAHVHNEGKAYYAHAGQWVALADSGHMHVITSAEIQDGTIQFGDIGQNGATVDQIMKWNGSAWLPSDDDAGGTGPSGWTDAGTVVRLNTFTDSVGIGTASPAEKLDVDGNAHVSGTIASGSSITIDGTSDVISASSGT